MSEVVAQYYIESRLPLREAAEVLAGEQSTGTFIAVPGESDELKERFAARVVSIDELDAPLTEGELPGTWGPDGAPKRGGIVKIAFPNANIADSLTTLLATVVGNLFDLRELAGVKLLDLDLPDSFAERYPGPRFGTAGTRELLGVEEGIMIGTIVKPSVGLSLSALSELVIELGEAGIDFIKDDELMASPSYSLFEDRVRVVMEATERVADRTGRRPMYCFNITDDPGRLERNYATVVEAGGTCVMACINTLGLPAVAGLAELGAVPIHGHRTMGGALLRHDALGIGRVAYQKLARLIGCDHLHTDGFHSKFYESDDQVLESVDAVLAPFLAGRPCLPVLSGGQSAATAETTWAKVGSTDLLVLAGGGIHGHPDGVRAGVESLREAWDATVGGESVSQRAETNDALAKALATFAR